MRYISVFALFILIYGCESQKLFSEYYQPIHVKDIQRIELVDPKYDVQSEKHLVFKLTDNDEVKEYAHRLNKAKMNGPWKGANGLRLRLIYPSDTSQYVVFKNQKNTVFAPGSSGIFFNLPEPTQKGI